MLNNATNALKSKCRRLNLNPSFEHKLELMADITNITITINIELMHFLSIKPIDAHQCRLLPIEKEDYYSN